MPTLTLNPDDDIVITLEAVTVASETVAAGHKLARRVIAAGQPVRRYGQVIGLARCDIAPGDWVHTHNLAMSEAPRPAEIGVDSRTVVPAAPQATFEGYRRQNGTVGTRNFVAVLTSVNCSATVARRVADSLAGEAEGMANVDGVLAFTHQGGCGGAAMGGDTALLQTTLAGYARHPNFAGVVVIGLGCEANQIPEWMEREGLSESERLRTFTIQDAGGTAAAIARGQAMGRELLQDASRARRQTIAASHLVVGLQCGGSDGWSGVTANPALGAAVDLLVAHGGSALLSETPEIWGAEHLLLRRAARPEVADALLARLDWWRAYAERHGMELNNNPSPGNLKGGLTTILEKSLGAVAKSGSTPLQDVIGYARPLRRHGLTFMDSPGYDPCSATGQTASGANLIAFTTGRGSVFGSRPAPCLKIASNAAMARRMADDMDIDASPVLNGTSLEAMGDLIFARMLATASGVPTKSEALGLGDHEFVPWQVGAYL